MREYRQGEVTLTLLSLCVGRPHVRVTLLAHRTIVSPHSFQSLDPISPMISQ